MKRAFIIAGVALAIGMVMFGVLLFFAAKPAAPVPQATPQTTETPTPGASPALSEAERKAEDGPNLSAQFPIIRRLPHNTPYWELAIAGEIRDGKIPLTATVYYISGTDEKAKIEEQRPYVIRYIESTGQAAGSYELEMRGKEINDSRDLS